jgi:hypothetical protein
LVKALTESVNGLRLLLQLLLGLVLRPLLGQLPTQDGYIVFGNRRGSHGKGQSQCTGQLKYLFHSSTPPFEKREKVHNLPEEYGIVSSGHQYCLY